MQKSTSFSDTRTGKPRPSDLLSARAGPSESLPWRSPSFDVFNALPSLDTTVSADPGRPSTQVKCSPTDGLPPTPLTATYKPVERNAVPSEKDQLRLPGVKDMLAHTPPDSNGGLRTVPLPDETEHYPPPPSASGPSTYRRLHGGSSPIRAGPQLPTHRQEDMALSPRHFRSMPQSDEVHGLGLDLGEETPRMGSQDWSMRTPTISHAPRLPGAPQLSSAQSGRMHSMITSPINPPLRHWNTDIRFDERSPYFPSSQPRSFNESGTPMEREQAMEIEGGMPQGHKLWGLAISLDDGETYRRGGYVCRSDGSIVGPAAMIRSKSGPEPAPAKPASAANPPTPLRPTEMATVPSSSSKASSSATPSMTTKHLKTTGLTPHIHKTRLTPTFSSRSKASSNGSPSTGIESPSLKMKSKQRSEQLRNQAASVVAHANLPSDHLSVLGQVVATAEGASPLRASSSPVSPVGPSFDSHSMREEAEASRTAPPTLSPRKRGLRARDSNAPPSRSPSNDSGKSPIGQPNASPWGVFELGSGNNNWQPLGPPALSNVLGKLNLDEAGDEDEEADDDLGKARSTKAKRPRKTADVQQRQRSESGSEEKENDVFGSRRTPVIGANASPNKPQSQRRLLSIR